MTSGQYNLKKIKILKRSEVEILPTLTVTVTKKKSHKLRIKWKVILVSKKLKAKGEYSYIEFSR